MNQNLKEKIREAFASVLPISAIVLFLCTLVVPMSLGTVVMFMVGAAFLTVGLGFFTLGADISMIPIGEGIGVQFTKSKKLWSIIIGGFLVGFIVTIAEPDLQALAGQVAAIPNQTLIMTIAVGVGIFLVLAILRVIFHISFSILMFISYGIIFALSALTPNNFVALSFDSGGVTTGPMTVPFILAMGAGLASVRKDKDSQGDSFGFVALGSIGPIIMVMLLGIYYRPKDTGYMQAVIPEVETMRDVLDMFTSYIPHSFKDVFMALFPIFIFFFLFQTVFRKYKKRQILKILVGLVYTFVGLLLFLTGVNVGFIPVGSVLGGEMAQSAYKWMLVPLGMLIGYFIVAAEPAIHVLNHQVEEVSGGAISHKAMNLCLSIGVCVSVGLAMIRVLTGISIYWFLIPGYLIALLLTRRVPRIFTSIAFDSGGVASGPMTSTFLLPFAIGACEGLGGNISTDAFGIVAMVAMTPLVTIQLMGYFYRNRIEEKEVKDSIERTKPTDNETVDDIIDLEDYIDEIIEFEESNEPNEEV